MDVEGIARVCHEENRSFCQTIGDNSQKSWEEADPWQRDSAVNGVEFAIRNPGAPASHQHDAWLADKASDGWVYGPVKDPSKKQHPCMVPYGELPLEQQLKDHLFKAIVSVFAGSCSTNQNEGEKA
jgi:hypothetical protein